MRKIIIAFYDLLLFSIICGPLLISSILIFVFGELNNLTWCLDHWYLLVFFAVGIATPLGSRLLFRYTIIRSGRSVYFHYFYFLASWDKAANNIDIRWNQDVIISEVKDIEIVKLTEEEKKTKVYYKHWFNKYLKINLKYGNSKYVYVGNYSNYQIKKIIRILTSQNETKS